MRVFVWVVLIINVIGILGCFGDLAENNYRAGHDGTPGRDVVLLVVQLTLGIWAAFLLFG